MTFRSIFHPLRAKDLGDPSFITVVSGLPRSGTSMMMKMLEAGGLDIVTDNNRTADEDNPKGYYELERVKKLKDGDGAWLADAQGRAVKVISALLEYLPPRYVYRVVFMRRNMPEILASQKQMLIRRGEQPDKVSDETMADLYRKHLVKIESWLARQTNMEILYVSYNELLADPQNETLRINTFLKGRLELEKMAQVVDRSLYRQRQ